MFDILFIQVEYFYFNCQLNLVKYQKIQEEIKLAIQIEIPNKEEKLKKLKSLIQKFSQNIKEYKNPNYNEANLRLEFLNPFFELLGWDVRNEQNFHINYKEVIVEERIDVYGSSKAPDYTFRIGGQTKFYVEAKKPSVDIKGSMEAAFQVKRYGHSARLSISVLTDFEEFSIYDTRKTPHKNDKPLKNRIAYYTYNQYIEKFDEIYGLLSKQAILQGSFEQFEKEDKYRKGNETVDEGILELVSNFREKLAKNIAKNNKNIDVYSLNRAVIKIIDRILFLRIAEDKNIEVYKTLLNIAQQENIYKGLKKVFLQADERYNSELFKYFREIDDLIIEDKILKEIIITLYEDCPYEFSVIPVSILGSMYEQFLGKTIHITPSNLVKIEDKPEVKKAGGVYYTPEYIVNYIVENTVGEKIKGLTPKQIEKIKILDPACGSGSFLIGAYQYLLDYHLNYYLKSENFENAKKKKFIRETKEGFILSIPQKQKILTNNIFGVDIDQQAVEVAKFSLLLKLMETEKQDIQDLIPQAQMYSDIKILPNLNKNIQCGNSLIGTDYFTNAEMALIEQDQLQKVNPFDWQKQFPEIFNNGGFDCVIGNPPYIDSEEMVKSQPETRNYCLKYDTAKGNWDMYCVFVEKGLSLLTDNGFFGYIIPNKFLSVPYGIHLRNYLSKYHINKIVDYSEIDVFHSKGKKVNVYPIILLVSKNNSNSNSKYIKMIDDNNISIMYEKDFVIEKNDINWTQKFDKLSNFIEKIQRQCIKISDYFAVESAATVSEAYKTKELIEDKKPTQKDLIFVNTGTIDRYNNLWGKQKTQYIKSSYQYPLVNRETLKSVLENRYKQSVQEKLILAGMVVKLEAIYDKGNILAGKSTTIVLKKDNNKYSLLFLLALLNSNFMTKYFTSINKYNSMSGGYLNVNKTQISNLPIPKIDLSNDKQKQMHDNLLKLVDQMLSIQQKINSAKNDIEKESFQKLANSIDDQIDEIVYKLYNLTEEEIKVIKNSI